MTKDDAIKIAKGAGIAAIGAVLTYLTAWISGADFGSYTPMVVAAWSIVANLVRKFITPTVAAAVVVAVLVLNGSASAAEPPAIKAKCLSCTDCKCPDGFCPNKCAVKAKAEVKQAGHWVQQCNGNSCRLVWVADSVAAAPVASAPCASCQSCEAPTRSGWWPGKFLGRRR